MAMRSDYRGLGFDPVPGAAEAVIAASTRCTRTATEAEDAMPAVRTAATVPRGDWTGPAADAYGGHLARAEPALEKTSRSMRAAADILDSWAGAVLANRRRAEELDRRALLLRRAVRDAEDEVERATTDSQFSGDPGAGTGIVRAEACLHAQRRELDSVINSAHALGNDHRATAEAVAERLRLLGDGDLDAATRVPTRAERFVSLTRTLGSSSALAVDLSSAILRGGTPSTPSPGAAAAFAGALGGQARSGR